MFNMLTALTIAAALLAPAAAAATQGRNCGDRDRIVHRLQNDYGEARTSAGLSNGNASMVEIFTSEETGTWTILVTTPDGQSCLVAAGDNWQGGLHALTGFGLPV